MDVDASAFTTSADLPPIVGLLTHVPSRIVEGLTISAMRKHRQLLQNAETLFEALPAEVRTGTPSGGEEIKAYLEAAIDMHAQMAALTTLISVLGYTPKDAGDGSPSLY